jgi:putative ABC transport system permease protein
MAARMLRAALRRRWGMASLAVLALVIGAAVTSALLHVSGDLTRKLSRELRSLGPNLLLVPESSRTRLDPSREETASFRPAWNRSIDSPSNVPTTVLDSPGEGTHFLSEELARTRLARAGVDGAALLYVVARVKGEAIQLIGADLDRVLQIHPVWKVAEVELPGQQRRTRDSERSWMGARLMRRLGVRPGERLILENQSAGSKVERVIGGVLEAGGSADESWWIPLRDAQALCALEGRISMIEARVSGDMNQALGIARALERGGGVRAIVVRALSATEAGLLEHVLRLMLLVTIAALAAAGLCAFGTLTDLALERRREIALMKALGASQLEIARQFALESLVIGLIGGAVGWILGLLLAEWIGRDVFGSAIALRWDVPLVVLGLSCAVAVLASFGPVRLALRVEPAAALRGE